MLPASTSWAPSHSTTTIEPNTMTITASSSDAVAFARCNAAENDCSIAVPKRRDSRASWAKACTVVTAPSVSPARADASASFSWLIRDSLRTRRPNTTSGSTTAIISTRM